MTTATITASEPGFDYTATAAAILAALRSERDRQIVSQRYGLGLPKRHTLEKIGSDFGITRERVRQIEKAATAKLKQQPTAELKAIDGIFRRHLGERGDIGLLDDVAGSLGATTPAQRAYITFLATLSPNIELIEEGDHYHAALALLPEYDRKRIDEITQQLVDHLTTHKKPTRIDALHRAAGGSTPQATVHQVARISKQLADLDDQWGLSHWPAVNPRSIRDKTYLILGKHGRPLHFTDIARHIGSLGSRKRDVTVQAVHNELIKDPRFVLVGRGIYALSEWGYTPGTVADIIGEVLRAQSPLHKDEIVKRVLKKRHVKTTTIVLNLQEKDQFVRVAKATYALK
jgi:hypothetical protein